MNQTSYSHILGQYMASREDVWMPDARAQWTLNGFWAGKKFIQISLLCGGRHVDLPAGPVKWTEGCPLVRFVTGKFCGEVD